MLSRGWTQYSTTIVSVGLFIAGLALYGASFNDPFHFDDTLILKDSNVTNAARWFHFFNPLHLRQLTFFTFYLNFLTGGDDPTGFHVVNVAIHIANAILLWHLLRRWIDPWIAAIASFIFLAHPIQTEAVLYVYQRSVLLACFFSLLALMALQRGNYWLAAFLFLCAFESKESAVAVPIAVALFQNRRGRIVLIAGGVMLAIAALAVLAYRGEKTVGLGLASEITPRAYALAELRMFYTYLRLLVWPHPQSLEYEFPSAPAFGGLVLQAGGVVAIVLLALSAVRDERLRIFGIAALAFLILLAPSSSIVPSRDVAFEHRLYLPMAAFAVLSASIIGRVPRRTWIAAPLLAILGVLTIARGSVWGSDVLLWEDTVQKAPGKARVWFNLGGALLKNDRVRARESLLKAIDLQPMFPEAYYDLGVLEQENHNAGLAVVYYDKAIEQQSNYWPAWNNLGNTLFAVGQTDKAIQALESTLRLNPDYWPAHYNLAVILFKTGRFDAAIPRLKIVLDWKPDFRDARYLFAAALAQAGHRNAADAQLKELERLGRATPVTPTFIPAPVRP